MRMECFVILLVITETSSFVNLVHSQGHWAVAAMTGTPHNAAWTANKAIDGNTSQDYQSNICAISNIDGDKLKKSYLKIWLERQFNIAYLEVYFRPHTCQRSTGFSIYIYDTHDFYPFVDPKHLIYQHDPLSGCPSPIMNVTVSYVTQGIVFINERPSGYRSNCQGDDNMYTGIDICEVKVMGCDVNRYSTWCNILCPSRCKNNQCDAFNGSCIHGCSNPNTLTIDCIVCPPSYYGIDCNTACGRCRGDEVCNNMTGYCPNGCKPHSTGLRCDECDDGYYSSVCTVRCGHCAHNGICHRESGYCLGGCVKNYKSPFCQECDNGFYGSRCNFTCGHCLNDENCDKSNGHCPQGCQLYFQPPLCQVCKDGFYGVNCSEKCGQCDDDFICDKITGYCLMGCKNNLQPPFCKEFAADTSELERRREKSMAETNNVPDAGFYAAIGILNTLLVLSIGVIIYQRRQISGFLRDRRQTENTQTRNPVQPQDYADITQSDEKHEYTSLDTVKQESHYNGI